IRAVMGRRRQTGFCVPRRFVVTCKIEPPTGIDHYSVEGLVIQNERERQVDHCVAPGAVIARVSVSWHDGIGAEGYRVLAGSTFCLAGDNLATDYISSSVTRLLPVRLGTTSSTLSRRSEDR